MSDSKSEKKTIRKIAKKSEGLLMKVYDIDGKEKKEIELPKSIFKADVNPKLLAQYVKVYLANQRQGTAATKTRGEVIGSTRKIYRQKGTGRARHGSIKAPIFVGGGVAHGVKPRDYSLKINKKQKRKALFGALTMKFKNKQIFGLIDDSMNIKIRTKTFADFLRKTNMINLRNLLIFPKLQRNNLLLASRNIKNVDLVDVRTLNPFQVLKSKNIIFIEGSLKILESIFKKNDTE